MPSEERRLVCRNCLTANPSDARYCMNCGTALVATFACPRCSTPIPTFAKFCNNCGLPLPSPAARLGPARPARALKAERRVVTMLFCDVKGSTAMAEKLDPEDWADIMNGAFEFLIEPVYRFEGTVVRLMGDAILAFFGAPIAHEDDPHRAVRAGLAIIQGIQEYRAEVKQSRGLVFDVRVGINTGLVVVGEVGSELKTEYSAMGDAINLAARMEQTASPGTLQITESTYRLVAPFVDAESLGPVEIKGKSEPLLTYRVTAFRAQPDRLFTAAGLSAPLVGRGHEMENLRGALAEVRQGRIVFLVGEAGLGKTRLIEELRREVEADASDGEKKYWHEIRSLPYGASRPYEQFRQHILSFSGIVETDSPETARFKLADMVAYASPEVQERALSVYSLLLGLDTSSSDRQGGTPPSLITGEVFKNDLFSLVLDLLTAWSKHRHSIMVFDDLQWIDPASGELLVHLFRMTEQAHVLFLCAYRPDPQAPSTTIREIATARYPGRSTEIVLNPLSPQESRTLLDHLLPEAGLPDEFKGQILERAEGNPLFIEEVAHALLSRPQLDQHGATAHVEIPDSLQALMTARIDELEEDARLTLQAAAVIGRSFSLQVLKEISDPSIPVGQEMEALQYAGLIEVVPGAPEAEFKFRHALTQEAAYQSILIKRRRELHLRVGEALEDRFARRRADYAGLIAHHYDAAGDGRASTYYRLAADRAASLYANEEAVSHYARALELAADASPQERIGLRRSRSEIYFFMGQFEAAAIDLEAALDLSRQKGLDSEECQVMADQVWLMWNNGRGAESLALARETEARTRQLGDPSLALRASFVLGVALQNEGDLVAAQRKTRQVLSGSRARHERILEARCLYFLAMQNNFMGRFGRAAACAKKSIQISLTIGDRRLASGAYLYDSLAEGGRGQYDAALEALEHARLLAEESVIYWGVRYYNQRSWLCSELGDWEEALRFDKEGLEKAQALTGFREIEISTQINMALDYTALGQLEQAQKCLEESQKDVDRPEYGVHTWRWRTRLADVQARLFLARSEHDRAAVCVVDLFDWAERTHARKYLTRGLLLRAQLRIAQGDLPSAAQDLSAAVQNADGMCYYPVRIEGRYLWKWLCEKQESKGLAANLLAELHSLVADLQSSIQHPDLQRCFHRGLAHQMDG